MSENKTEIKRDRNDRSGLSNVNEYTNEFGIKIDRNRTRSIDVEVQGCRAAIEAIKIPGYKLYDAPYDNKDKPNFVLRMQEIGYTFVTAVEANYRNPDGTLRNDTMIFTPDKKGGQTVLMKIPLEYYQADMLAKVKRNCALVGQKIKANDVQVDSQTAGVGGSKENTTTTSLSEVRYE